MKSLNLNFYRDVFKWPKIDQFLEWIWHLRRSNFLKLNFKLLRLWTIIMKFTIDRHCYHHFIIGWRILTHASQKPTNIYISFSWQSSRSLQHNKQNLRMSLKISSKKHSYSNKESMALSWLMSLPSHQFQEFQGKKVPFSHNTSPWNWGAIRC